MESHLRDIIDYKVKTNRLHSLIPIQLPNLVTQNGRQVITFPMYEDGSEPPSLYIVDQLTMEIKQEIPEALCFINFTNDGNVFYARVKLTSDNDLELDSFVERAWIEWHGSTERAVAEPKYGEVKREVKADTRLVAASFISAHQHGVNVTVILHGYDA